MNPGSWIAFMGASIVLAVGFEALGDPALPRRLRRSSFLIAFGMALFLCALGGWGIK